MKPAEVSAPDETSVVVNRTFAAPLQLVWRAYTEADLLRRWCQGPPGWSMPVCEMDSKTGGLYRWRWRDDSNGTEFGFQGEFLEVVVNSKIVHTQVYDPGDLGISMGGSPWIITVEFQEAGEVTKVTTTFAFATREDRDAAMDSGMTEGMETSYQHLDETLTSVAS
ncbi:MAG: SRPBCC domain-containing protein [Planctomycetales bacterium]|nr:SRPBCC domain-containing protein [Planctomycetales bacterium]